MRVPYDMRFTLSAALLLAACSPTGDDGSPTQADPGLVQLRVAAAPTGSSIATVQFQMTGDPISLTDFVPASGVRIRASMQGDGSLLAIVQSSMSPGKVLGTICVSDRTDLAEHASAVPIQLAAGAPTYALLNAVALTIEATPVEGACTPTP